MAPKGALTRLKLALAELERAQTPTAGAGGKAGRAQANWACAYCTAGGNNFAHRTNCYKCLRDRRTGAIVTPTPQRSTQVQLPSGGKTRARSQGPPAGADQSTRGKDPQPPVPSQTGEDPPQPGDAVALELATARSLHEWARKLGPEGREKELPGALERLNKAEAADKARKPPGERLQSALSRVEHRRRLAEAATKAYGLLADQASAAKAEMEQAEASLKEAKQELETAQQVHSAWGSPDGGAGVSYAGPLPGSGAGFTGEEREVLEKCSVELSASYPQAANILLGLLSRAPGGTKGGEAPAPPPGEPASTGPEPPTGEPKEKIRKTETNKTRSRSPKSKQAPGRGKGDDAAMDDSTQAP
jgi:hypothetical protein